MFGIVDHRRHVEPIAVCRGYAHGLTFIEGFAMVGLAARQAAAFFGRNGPVPARKSINLIGY